MCRIVQRDQTILSLCQHPFLSSQPPYASIFTYLNDHHERQRLPCRHWLFRNVELSRRAHQGRSFVRRWTSLCNHAQSARRRLTPLRLRGTVERISLVIAERDGGGFVQTGIAKNGRYVARRRAEPSRDREAMPTAGCTERVATNDTLTDDVPAMTASTWRREGAEAW